MSEFNQFYPIVQQWLWNGTRLNVLMARSPPPTVDLTAPSEPYQSGPAELRLQVHCLGGGPNIPNYHHNFPILYLLGPRGDTGQKGS